MEVARNIKNVVANEKKWIVRKEFEKELTNKQFDLITNNKIQELHNFLFLKDTIKYKTRILFSWINDEIFSDSIKKSFVQYSHKLQAKKE